MDSENISQNLEDDVNGDPNPNSLREVLGQEELFISIYRKEKISFYFFELLANTIILEILQLFLAGFLMKNLKYYFFMGFWFFYDWVSSMFLIHQLMLETK